MGVYASFSSESLWTAVFAQPKDAGISLPATETDNRMQKVQYDQGI
jgi:hypothetical protein